MAVEKVFTTTDKKTHKTEKDANHHERFLVLQTAIKKSKVRIPSMVKRDELPSLINDLLDDILKVAR